MSNNLLFKLFLYPFSETQNLLDLKTCEINLIKCPLTYFSDPNHFADSLYLYKLYQFSFFFFLMKYVCNTELTVADFASGKKLDSDTS